MALDDQDSARLLWQEEDYALVEQNVLEGPLSSVGRFIDENRSQLIALNIHNVYVERKATKIEYKPRQEG